MTPPRPETTLVVLLGAEEWPRCQTLARESGADPAHGGVFRQSCEEFRRYLLAEDGFNLPLANLLDLFNFGEPGGSVVPLYDRVRAFLCNRPTGSVAPTDLLVYYVGHGQDSPTGTYCLLVRESRPDQLEETSIRLGVIATIVRDHARELRVFFVLDACYSGRAKDADTWRGLYGVAVLCSSNARYESQAPKHSPLTRFTGTLLCVLRPSTGTKPLSFRDVRDQVRARIDALVGHDSKAGRPELHAPQQLGGDITEIPFFPSTPPPSPEVRAALAESEAGQALAALQSFDWELRRLQKQKRAAIRWAVGQGVVLVLVVGLLTTVWPTLYVPHYNLNGIQVTDVRVSRIDGTLQKKNEATGTWEDVTFDELAMHRDLIQNLEQLTGRIVRAQNDNERRRHLKELGDFLQKRDRYKMVFSGHDMSREREKLKAMCLEYGVPYPP